jgi:hypothetical protein
VELFRTIKVLHTYNTRERAFLLEICGVFITFVIFLVEPTLSFLGQAQPAAELRDANY